MPSRLSVSGSTTTDWVGVAVSLAGMAIIMFGRRPE